jgi:hypothetical protein
MNAKVRLLGISASLLASSALVAQPPAAINVPAAPPGVIAQPVVPPPAPQPPIVQGPPVQVVPGPVVPGPVVPMLPATPLTLAQAERALRCLPPGCHHLLLIHPVTCCPVAVTVRINGCLTDVKATKFLGTHKLVFKVKGWNNDVVVKFKHNGGVVVND